MQPLQINQISIIKKSLLICVLIALTSSCSHTQNKNNLLDIITHFSEDTTCISAGLINICDSTNNKSTLLLQAFDHKSDIRSNVALNSVATNSKIQKSNIELLEASHKLNQEWNSKLKHISKFSLIQATNFLNITNTDLNKLIKLKQFKLPPLIDIDLTSNTFNINHDSLVLWVAFFKNNPEFETSCSENGKIVACSEIFQRAEFLKDLSEMGKTFHENNINQELGLFIAFIRFQNDMENSLSTQGRKVYVVKADKFSPQVDFLGNLYVPENFNDLFSPKEQDLILNHEAAHVSGFIIDYLLAISKNVLDNHKSEWDFEITYNKLLPILRQPDEMLIDLIAASVFEMNETDLKLTSTILSKFEPTIDSRSYGLKLLGELINQSVNLSEVLRNRLELLIQSPMKNSLPVNSINLKNSSSKNTLQKYKYALVKYIAYKIPSYIVAFTDYTKIDLIKAKSAVEQELLTTECSELNFPEGNNGSFSIKLCTLNLR